MGLIDHIPWAAIASAALSYFVGLIFYRLCLHPLAKFPGPKLAAVTRYYEGYYDVILNGQYTFKIAELHQQYGPIVRISPHELHVNDPAYYEKLYRQEGKWNKYDWSYDAFGAPMSAVCVSIPRPFGNNLKPPKQKPLSFVACYPKHRSGLNVCACYGRTMTSSTIYF